MGMKKICELSALAVLLASTAVICFTNAWESRETSFLKTFALGWMGMVMMLLCVVCVDMARQSPSDSHTAKTLLIQYIYVTGMYIYGYRFYNTLLKIVQDCGKFQEDFLLAVVKKNQDTMFGKAHKFNDINTRDDFRKNVKLHQYADVKAYMNLIEDGRPGVMTTDAVVYLATSSGTTGANKVLPVTSYMKGSCGIGMAALFVYQCHQRAGMNLQKEINLLYMPKWTRLPCGLVKGPVSYHMMRYVPFCTAPEAAYKINVETAALYVQAVFGMREREVGSFTSTMATLVYAFWKMVALRWQGICDDIEHGRLNDDLRLEPRIRLQLEEELTPDPERAAQLRDHFKQGLGGIAKRIWPDLKFARLLTTGAFYHYSKALAEQELKGVPQVSLVHAASEGFLGITMNPHDTDTHYMAHPLYGFLEFIPEEKCHEEQPQTFFIEQLEKGKSYEIVITSPMGLYRYRMGDVVKVEGHIGQCPVYSCQYRIGQLLNLFWEKTPENVFYECVQSTCEKLGVILSEYTSTEDIHAEKLTTQMYDKKHYILFIELKSTEKEDRILGRDECLQFDESLCRRLELYNSLRQNGSIAPMRVVQVRPGTFYTLKHSIIKASQNQQFKMPTVMRNEDRLRMLFEAQIMQ